MDELILHIWSLDSFKGKNKVRITLEDFLLVRISAGFNPHWDKNKQINGEH